MNKVETYNRKNILSQIKWLIKMVRHLLKNTNGGGEGIQSIQAGNNITVDSTDPQNPIISSIGGGDFIPLSGTEVGKPLTGEIEVDANSTGWVGFKAEDDTLTRRISITDDSSLEFLAESDQRGSHIETRTSGVSINSYDTGGSNVSQFFVGPDTLKLSQSENPGASADKGELTINRDQFSFTSQVDGGGEFNGEMYYNSEEGFYIRDLKNGYYTNIHTYNISGRAYGRVWSISKLSTDTGSSLLLFPDSVNTSRRIPVSVNGNFADEFGNIEIESGGSTPTLLEVLTQDNNAEDKTIKFSYDDGEIEPQTAEIGFLQSSGFLGKTPAFGTSGFYVTPSGFRSEFFNAEIVMENAPGGETYTNFHITYNDSSSRGITANQYFGANYDDNTYVQKKYVDDFYKTIPGYDEEATQTLKNINGVMTWVTEKVG